MELKHIWKRVRGEGGRPMAPRGMTLVEVMVVVTILAAIMGVIGFTVFGQLNQAKTETARLGIQKLRGKVQSYYLMNSPNQLPDNLEDLTKGNDSLIQDPGRLKDPWGNTYIYEKKGNQDFEIYSAGPDGQRGTEDDVRKRSSGNS